MKMFRKVVFWLHLSIGLLVALDVALLAATGLIMSFEHNIVAWAEKADGSPPTANTQRLPVETLLARAQEIQTGATPTPHHGVGRRE